MSVPPERFELSTDGFEVQYSIQLSYRGSEQNYNPSIELIL